MDIEHVVEEEPNKVEKVKAIQFKDEGLYCIDGYFASGRVGLVVNNATAMHID